MAGPVCGLCGEEAKGFAEINGVAYCHDGGDTSIEAMLAAAEVGPLTCYQLSMDLGPESERWIGRR